MTIINDPATKAAWIASMTAQIQARLAEQPPPGVEAPEAPPPALSPTQRMAWARANQPPEVELQQSQPVHYQSWDSLPQAVKEMRPTDRMKWVRRQHARTGE